ncbi:MAG: alpha/beta hydrolase [Actinobacteria bacterium]|nr:alpha/beta hydrolase [Actinomycetota bacterium]
MREAYAATNAIRLFYLEDGEVDAPLVLLLHGFPELAYSWRHQLEPLAAAGYRAVAVDLPGYGRSDKPDVAYDVEWVNACLAGLVRSLGHERVVVAGHDWGGLLAWPFARRYSEMTAGVIGLNTPDLPRPAIPPVQLMRQVFDPPVYIVQLQDRGVAEWVLSWGRGARDFLEMMFRNEATARVNAFPDDVLDVYVEAFSPVGAFTPPIEYYRNLDRNWELTADLADVRIEVPCLMISAAGDPVLSPAMTVGMEERVPKLRRVVIEDCGHWTQQERPAETTAAMLEYLATLPPW